MCRCTDGVEASNSVKRDTSSRLRQRVTLALCSLYVARDASRRESLKRFAHALLIRQSSHAFLPFSVG